MNRLRSPLWEVGVEESNDGAEISPDRWECFQAKPSRAERYLRGELRLHLDWRVGHGIEEVDPREFHAVFERAPEPHRIDRELEGGTYRLTAEASGERLDISQAREGGMDRAVLIGIDVCVEESESADLGTLASRVRLQALDEPGVLVSDATYPLHPRPLVVPFATEDREAGELTLTGLSSAEPDQLIREIVEGGAPVVEDVAEDQTEPKRRLFSHVKPRDVETIRVCLAGNRIGVTFEVGVGLRPEFCKVFVRPAELRAGVVQ